MTASYVGGKETINPEDTSLSGEATLLRLVGLDEAMSFILAVGDIGGSPLVAAEMLLFISRLRSAKLEKPLARCAEVRELSNWKGETVVLSKGKRFEFEPESVCPSN